jgi:hypothetical protein
MRTFGTVLCFLLLTGAATAADNVAQCETSHKLAGPCFVVHGRLSVYNGSGNYRIWPVGSHRLLGVVNASGTYSEGDGTVLPENVRAALDKNGAWSKVFADYRVCPLTRSQPDHMQHVCVVRATKIVIRDPAN